MSGNEIYVTIKIYMNSNSLTYTALVDIKYIKFDCHYVNYHKVLIHSIRHVLSRNVYPPPIYQYHIHDSLIPLKFLLLLIYLVYPHLRSDSDSHIHSDYTMLDSLMLYVVLHSPLDLLLY